MDTALIIMSSLQIIAFCFIGILIKYYFSKYISKKAENLATKEDIYDITRITEEAKKSYVHEVEKLRNDSIILPVKNSLQSVQKAARLL